MKMFASASNGRQVIMEGWAQSEKDSVWKKGAAFGTNDPNEYRKDAFGAVMQYSAYGNRDHKYGWEVDHIDCDRENNELENLRPLYWNNNCARNADPDSDGKKRFWKFNGKKESAKQANDTEIMDYDL